MIHKGNELQEARRSKTPIFLGSESAQRLTIDGTGDIILQSERACHWLRERKKSTLNTICWDWGGDAYVLTLDSKRTLTVIDRVQITQTCQVFILTQLHRPP